MPKLLFICHCAVSVEINVVEDVDIFVLILSKKNSQNGLFWGDPKLTLGRAGV